MQTSQIDYGKGLSWYLNDKKLWPTVLTLSLYLLSCVLILPAFYVFPLITGYTLAIIRNIQAGKYEVPDIGGDQWREGAILILFSIVASLVVGFIVGAFMLGFIILANALQETAPVTSTVLSMVATIGTMVLQFAASFLAPIIYMYVYAIYAKTGTVNSLVQWSNYVEMTKRNGASLIIGALLYFVASSALSTLGFFACCIGILPAIVLSLYVMAGLVGQYDVTDVQ